MVAYVDCDRTNLLGKKKKSLNQKSLFDRGRRAYAYMREGSYQPNVPAVWVCMQGNQ